MTNNSNSIPLTLNSRSLLIVPLPDNEDDIVLYYWLGTDNKIYANFGQLDDAVVTDLPSGEYRLLFVSDSATEEDCKGLFDDGTVYTISYKELCKSWLMLLGVTGSAAVLEKVNV